VRIDVVTLFPEMVCALLGYGVTGRAVARGLIEVATWNPREYTRDRHHSVDDRPYGGGPGMVMTFAPLTAAIRAARAAAGPGAEVVYLSPQGRQFDQAVAREMAGRAGGFVLIAGRYEGIDERVIDAEVDAELSIGDYVLSGGELAALVVLDSVIRLLPGVLGDSASAAEDSFMDGLLDYPHYTRPETVAGMAVPGVLVSGDHAAIRRWRLKQALARTWRRRPDLLAQAQLTAEQRELLEVVLNEQRELKGKRQ
jgi:tRNA (guanine37-N1)-methyltransferase